ncbi:AIPR family protein [Acinetobacter indicus]|uniref:AIPR family protein n=1 Tax=Acinetobacter indicus TaxID=756892 RepID=UPI0009489030|nr:AIPR family protein [Acinetobacter indicus]
MSNNAHIILQQIIEDQRKDLEITQTVNKFFGNFSAIQLLKNHELSYEEIEKGDVDGSLDGGIDNFYIFINGDLIDWNCFDISESQSDKGDSEEVTLNINYIKEKYKKNIEIEIILIQSKLENSFNETPITKLKDSLGNLLNLDNNLNDFNQRYNSPVIEAFSAFRAIYLNLISRRCDVLFNIFYTSKGSEIHPNVRDQANELKSIIESKITNTKAEISFVGAQRLIDLYQKIPNTDFELNLVENTISNNSSSYICLVNIKEFFRFITDDNQILVKHIFESNVRDYQGANNVNSEISKTLQDNKTEDFWWLNNGVTILSTQVTPRTNKQLIIQNPEIVNGLQTSSEIYRYFKENPQIIKDDESRNVLVRVIVPSSEEVRDKIIKATNSQTQIPKSSLRATDPIHRQIETYLKTKEYYYDRRKNFYKNEGKKPKQIISIPFMSQCLISVLMQKPDYARARPSSLLDDDSSYNLLYSEKTPLNVFYIVSHIGKKIEALYRNIEGLESNQSSDIKFHILYSVFCLAVKSHKPNVGNVDKINEESVLENIDEAVKIVRKLYLENGGNNKTAKSQKFKERLINEIQEVIKKKDIDFSVVT